MFIFHLNAFFYFLSRSSFGNGSEVVKCVLKKTFTFFNIKIERLKNFQKEMNFALRK